MTNNEHLTRRGMLQTAAVAAGAILTTADLEAADEKNEPTKAKGNIKQSVCRWCYGKVELKKLAEEAAKMGYKSIELLKTDEYPIVKPLGLTCAMLSSPGVGIPKGLNRKENHEKLIAELKKTIEFAAAEGLPSVICFSGNREGMADDEGLNNCAIGLKQIVGFAEEKKVTICMELLNSKVNHKDYMCDRTPWGVQLVKKVGSERFKLLYDIYHMQIMEGDVISTIKANKDYIGHYHTGGVPGRHEIDETQELYYPAIVKAILETKYTGYLGQEYIPARDPLPSLAQGFKICDV